ncbi:MAG: MerR family DNA-binding transcriptional regulator, partial [Candidatus Helarchaeota archaeon]
MKLSLRISEAARRLGVCVKTLRRWNAQGKMSCVRTVGGIDASRFLRSSGYFRGTLPQPLI